MPEIMALRKAVSKKYSELYEKNNEVPGYREAVYAFDEFLKDPNNKDFIGDYVNHTHDLIASDREAAAFMMVLAEFGIVGQKGERNE